MVPLSTTTTYKLWHSTITPLILIPLIRSPTILILIPVKAEEEMRLAQPKFYGKYQVP